MKSIQKNIFIIHLLVLLSSCSKEIKVDFAAFNIYHEGTKVDNGFNQIKEVVLAVNPDVIGFTEVRNYDGDWTTKIQTSLKESNRNYYRGYVGGDISLLSKFPIIDSVLTGNGSIGKFTIDIKGKIITVAVAHLDYTQYACYLPRGYFGGTPNWGEITDKNGQLKPIKSIDSILSYNLSSQRDEQINSFLKSIQNSLNPIVLLGDFNEPSHLDWQRNTKSLFDHNELVINWQNSIVLKENEFIDSYREIYPNVVKNPGFTWPSSYSENKSTSWTPKADERDRIDFIYYKGKDISVLKSAIIGPKEYYVRNVVSTKGTENDTYLASELNWPSDHKAVFTSLIIK
ncbi:endonuclease/exonuclease/phosphatase family protein [Polaribacter uvawellassae]|uniref:endonuclease/exonuclease/phosphatase family protein n=1 Tax=Polaribacter uvawellassae TaxID=3133495 RepID=UPI003219B156